MRWRAVISVFKDVIFGLLGVDVDFGDVDVAARRCDLLWFLPATRGALLIANAVIKRTFLIMGGSIA